MSEQAPHTLSATFDGEWFTPVVTCPYDGKGERPCQLIEEARDCDGRDCDGVESAQWGHSHSIDGCAVQQYISEAGQEAVAWADWDLGTTLPAPFAVRWINGEYPECSPLVPAKATT
jgi:hypothetical protein